MSGKGTVEKQLSIVRLRPRPRLSSEFRRQLHAERDKLRAGSATAEIAERLERLSETIAYEEKAIPIEIDQEDSLVTHVSEGLEVASGSHRR